MCGPICAWLNHCLLVHCIITLQVLISVGNRRMSQKQGQLNEILEFSVMSEALLSYMYMYVRAYELQVRGRLIDLYQIVKQCLVSIRTGCDCFGW